MSLSSLLAGITEKELIAVANALIDVRDEQGVGVVANDRLRIAKKYPAFTSLMLSDAPDATTNPEVY